MLTNVKLTVVYTQLSSTRTIHIASRWVEFRDDALSDVTRVFAQRKGANITMVKTFNELTESTAIRSKYSLAVTSE